jgi:uncharacterized protein (TIGR02246 family)
MKTKTYFSVFIFILGCISFSCKAPQKEMDMTQVRQAIEEENAKFGEAVRQADGAAIAGLYTEDATLLPPDSDLIKGRGGIEAFWKGGLQMGIKEAVLTTVDLSGGGDLAYEIGKFALKIQPEGQEPIEQKGKYVVVWKKAPDAGWKLHVDIWNSGPAATQGR